MPSKNWWEMVQMALAVLKGRFLSRALHWASVMLLQIRNRCSEPSHFHSLWFLLVQCGSWKGRRWERRKFESFLCECVGGWQQGDRVGDQIQLLRLKRTKAIVLKKDLFPTQALWSKVSVCLSPQPCNGIETKKILGVHQPCQTIWADHEGQFTLPTRVPWSFLLDCFSSLPTFSNKYPISFKTNDYLSNFPDPASRFYVLALTVVFTLS